jgi:hypothetical protein
MATITLTQAEKLEWFHAALCNGLGQVEGYGLSLKAKREEYTEAKATLKKQKGDNVAVCYEDILVQILKDGGTLKLRDEEGGEEDAVVDLATMLERMDTLEDDTKITMIQGYDDADTADNILQIVFLNEIIYG